MLSLGALGPGTYDIDELEEERVYVTGEMDPSGGSVSPGQNITGGMEPDINTNI